MPVIMALVSRVTAFFKDMSDDILVIYAEKGIAPFKKPLFVALPAILLLYAAVYLPLKSKINTESIRLKKLQLIAQHSAGYEDAKTRLAAYQRRLPLIKDKDEWLNYVMTSTAKAHGISFDSLSEQTEAEIGDFLLVSRAVTVTTTYAQFGKWMVDIEHSPILLKVAEVDIKKDSSSMGMVKINMKLSTIFQRIRAAGGAI